MEDLIEETENFVSQLFLTALDSKFVYHSLAHTQRVVEKTKELSESSEIDQHDKDLLVIAAWLHDTGYTTSIENHEDYSVEICRDFLKDKAISRNDTEQVCKLIYATRMNQNPKTNLEGILKDADCAHLASKDYDAYASLLKKEWESTQNIVISNTEWIKKNIGFLTSHRYFSSIAIQNWEQPKNKNLARLLKTQNKAKEKSRKLKHKKEILKLKKYKQQVPDRGIETMFRVALKNHITLSDIADTKANILLSVNAIIISVALSNLLPKLDNPSNTYLIAPTLIFLGFTVVCIILSVIATRPNVTKGKFTKEDLDNKKVNILFFGNFHQMKFDEFDSAMQEVMEDKRYLYGSLTKDLYYLGLVLNRKYNLLRVTYTVFMIGIIVSVLAFAISFLMTDMTKVIS